jgi:pyruvate,water dikinase
MTTLERATTAAPDLTARKLGVHAIAELRREDVPLAGGKGANLGELTSAGLPVPPGFVIGAPVYAAFVDRTGLRARIEARLAGLDVDNPAALEEAAREVRALIEAEPVPADIAAEITRAYEELAGDEHDAPVAVRSSATAEDTEAASFAGMNETFLNTRGADAVVAAVRRCWSSLFGARTIFYRAKRGFGQADMDIAVVVERQIASERAGVMFTIDPASGASDRLVIEGSFGLGEAVVSGRVSPDRYVVDKATLTILVREIHPKEAVIEPRAGGGTVVRELSGEEAIAAALTDGEVRTIAELGRTIEQHYGSPQDTEWAIDADGKIWMLQSRPVTSAGAAAQAEPHEGAVLLRGLGAAPGGASGPVRILANLGEADKFVDRAVLVTRMTAPDWVPLMRRAAAIATDSGGMTCHAAIVSRELGIPCVVGTQTATRTLRDDEVVTVDATRGLVLEGAALTVPPVVSTAVATGVAVQAATATATSLLLNLSEPSQVSRAAALDVDGVGLLRAELMLLEALEGKHPRLLLEQGASSEFVKRMAEGLQTFAAGFAPRPVTYRTTDFRTNEFRNLEGGDRFEPEEANPMIGVRGALRYTREPDLFAVELEAIRRVWDDGHTNLHVMLPFVRTTPELARCRALIAESGLLDRPGFELWVMAEVPSVLFNLDDYAALGVAGISIGSNDLTQLVLGADRDSEQLAELFDERDPAVVSYLRKLIPAARRAGLKTSICGQAPSVYPEYTELLVRAGIDAISVNIDVVDRTRRLIDAAERRVLLDAARCADREEGRL